MATVPLQQTPTTTIDTGSPSLLPAQGQVAAFETNKPREIAAFGSAMSKTGEQVTIIARKLQDELDDARSKELYNSYALDLERTTLEYMGLQGRSAVAPSGRDADGNSLTAFDAAVANLNGQLAEYIEQADNPRQQYMLREMAQTSIRSAASQMVRHSIAEQRRYADQEGKAQITVLAQQAGLHALSWNDPEGEFASHAAAAIVAANAYADQRGWSSPDPDAEPGTPEAMGSYQRQELINATWDTMHTSVLFKLTNEENFYGAAAYLESAVQNGTISPNTAMRFGGAIQVGYDRQAGREVADGIISQTTSGTGNPNSGQFIDAANFVMGQSTSYAANDGTGPVRFGLRMSDGFDVGNMDRGQALEAMQGIWALRPASLPAEAQAGWLYLATHLGVDKANQLSAGINTDADNPLLRLISQARVELAVEYGGDDQRILSVISGLESLSGRPAEIRTDENGIPMLADLLANARATITDADQLESAEARIKTWHSEREAIVTDEYNRTLASAQDIAFARIGGWQDIPASQWAAIRPEDKALLREGPNRGDDPDTVLEIERNPLLMLPGAIEEYRMKLSEQTYLNFVKRGIAAQNAEPPNPASISTDNAMFDTELANYGLEGWINPSSDSKKLDVAQLTNQWRTAIDQFQTANGNRPVTQDQRRQLLQEILNNRVRASVDWWFDGDPLPVAMLDQDELESAYVQIGTEQIFLVDIPVSQRTQIMTSLRNAGQPVSEQRIAELWVQAGKPR